MRILFALLTFALLFCQDAAADCNSRIGVNLGNRFEDIRWNGDIKSVNSTIFTITNLRIPVLRIPIDIFRNASNSQEAAAFARSVIIPIARNYLNGQNCLILNFHNKDLSDGRIPSLTFISYWKEFTKELIEFDDHLLFELINEPSPSFDSGLLNSLYQQAVPEIRAIDSNRPLLLSPNNWARLQGLATLKIPKSNNLFLAIHYYAPSQFTHQGAKWIRGSDAWIGRVWPNSLSEARNIEVDFATVDEWLATHQGFSGVFISEFGSIRSADSASRNRWTRKVIDEIRARSWSGAVWQFDSAFGIFDTISNKYLVPIE